MSYTLILRQENHPPVSTDVSDLDQNLLRGYDYLCGRIYLDKNKYTFTLYNDKEVLADNVGIREYIRVAKINKRIIEVQELLELMAPEERLRAISGICKYCGWESTICNGVCMRDE